MEIILKTPEKMILRGKIRSGLANAIRRSVEEVQTLAVDEVEIFKNDSALYDEVIAHRIGLFPLKTEARMGPKTSVELTLKKTGPCIVYSGDMKGNVKMVYDKIPVTLLEEGQEIELIATARLGNGVEHTKYSPGMIYYRNIFEVKVGNTKIDGIVEKSEGVMKPEKRGNKWICDLNEARIDEIKSIDKDALVDSDETLIFVESFGSLDAEKIFEKAINSLEINLDEFEKSIK